LAACNWLVSAVIFTDRNNYARVWPSQSLIAQWQSSRLLTGRFLVRIQVREL
jgi:hypothetical protein